jgi:hypothetical protein
MLLKNLFRFFWTHSWLAICFDVGILLGLLDPEDRGDMFLRIVRWLLTDYTRYIPEDSILHNHRCENLKSYINS